MNPDPRRALVGMTEDMLLHACVEHLPEDEVEFAASMYPLPTDTGWAPSLFVYLMIQPVGDADGAHMGEFTSPYGVTQELIDSIVKEFADRTAVERAAIREMRASGAEAAQGVALD